MKWQNAELFVEAVRGSIGQSDTDVASAVEGALETYLKMNRFVLLREETVTGRQLARAEDLQLSRILG